MNKIIPTELDSYLIKKTILLSIFYLLFALTYASFSNIIIYMHEKYQHHGYGQLYLTANSMSTLLSYFYCSAVIKQLKLTSRNVLLLGSFGYTLNYLIPTILGQGEVDSNGNVSPPSAIRVLIEIIGNIVGGTFAAFVWVIQGGYLSRLLA